MLKKNPLVLMILDGWGYSEKTEHNAIAAAHTPQWDTWWQTRPHTLLDASGQAVGLPDLQMGNSEVGHMHIGAGRVIPQDFMRINLAIETGTYYKNPIFLQTLADMQNTHHSIHLMGLLSPGGVHSHEQHVFAFLDLCQQHHFSNIYLHLFLDGRDTPPQSALMSIDKLRPWLEKSGASIASISGRYFAMDRDKRWQRLEPVYQLLTANKAEQHFDSVETAIESYYQQDIFDEFIPPTRIGKGAAIQNGDSVFFFNFRADRARQLTQALIAPEFQGFHREIKPHIRHYISMTQYADYLHTEPAFPPFLLKNTLGEILSVEGLKQLRIAETEKYAHVTFFFNGGSEHTFAGEQRKLISSPQIATYDLQPEMSAPELTAEIVNAIQSQQYDVIICNYANADMVGHSGNFAATRQAIEVLDQSMQAIWRALQHEKGSMLITADHGNAELMFNEKIQQAHTAHTTQPVPLLFVSDEPWEFIKEHGSLIDIAPTILALLNIKKPLDMTGKALLVKK